MIKNPLFCENVIHSWMTRCIRRRVIKKPNTRTIHEEPEVELVTREGQRLLLFLNELIEGIEQKEQISEKKDQLISYSLSQDWLSGWGPRWWGRRKESQHELLLLSESLVEQFIAQLDMEDVHERELFLLVWKHFILSLVSSLQEVIRKRSRSCLSLSSSSIESNSSSDSSSLAPST